MVSPKMKNPLSSLGQQGPALSQTRDLHAELEQAVNASRTYRPSLSLLAGQGDARTASLPTDLDTRSGEVRPPPLLDVAAVGRDS